MECSFVPKLLTYDGDLFYQTLASSPRKLIIITHHRLPQRCPGLRAAGLNENF